MTKLTVRDLVERDPFDRFDQLAPDTEKAEWIITGAFDSLDLTISEFIETMVGTEASESYVREILERVSPESIDTAESNDGEGVDDEDNTLECEECEEKYPPRPPVLSDGEELDLCHNCYVAGIGDTNETDIATDGGQITGREVQTSDPFDEKDEIEVYDPSDLSELFESVGSNDLARARVVVDYESSASGYVSRTLRVGEIYRNGTSHICFSREPDGRDMTVQLVDDEIHILTGTQKVGRITHGGGSEFVLFAEDWEYETPVGVEPWRSESSEGSQESDSSDNSEGSETSERKMCTDGGTRTPAYRIYVRGKPSGELHKYDAVAIEQIEIDENGSFWVDWESVRGPRINGVVEGIKRVDGDPLESGDQLVADGGNHRIDGTKAARDIADTFYDVEYHWSNLDAFGLIIASEIRKHVTGMAAEWGFRVKQTQGDCVGFIRIGHNDTESDDLRTDGGMPPDESDFIGGNPDTSSPIKIQWKASIKQEMIEHLEDEREDGDPSGAVALSALTRQQTNIVIHSEAEAHRLMQALNSHCRKCAMPQRLQSFRRVRKELVDAMDQRGWLGCDSSVATPQADCDHAIIHTDYLRRADGKHEIEVCVVCDRIVADNGTVPRHDPSNIRRGGG